MGDIDVAGLQAWIGHRVVAEDPMAPFGARALAALLAHARVPGVGDTLPFAWHWLYFLEAPSDDTTGLDGHPRTGDFLPPIPLPRRMWASGALERERPVRLGMPAERCSTIVAIEAKHGRSGPLVFVTLQHEIRQRGALCIRERQTLVYREAARSTGELPAAEPARIAAEWSRRFLPSTVLLFRFSALTYNAHRIHYDRDYATRVECYPDLVVHGPLLVIQLLDLVENADIPVALATVRFRAVRPSFVDVPIHLRAQRDGDSIVFCSVDDRNQVGMSAVATVRSNP